ncbi:tmcB-like protein [Carpediemonas membranifera]|uniref:TmcB-like protein n=1 Tax=Carpediemonas membranifera TaxID=201153 RepID=A0A8J6EBB3_9EUKA|nr:tmcB-like protein [Carpediemonas membranifera]|eukprot:KAG9396745.1 tmcB-like protein [Carpediemonas membranifera]
MAAQDYDNTRESPDCPPHHTEARASGCHDNRRLRFQHRQSSFAHSRMDPPNKPRRGLGGQITTPSDVNEDVSIFPSVFSASASAITVSEYGDTEMTASTTEEEYYSPLTRKAIDRVEDAPIAECLNDTIGDIITPESNSEQTADGSVIIHNIEVPHGLSREVSRTSADGHAETDSPSETSGLSSISTGSSFFGTSAETGIQGVLMNVQTFLYEVVYLVVKGNTFLTPLMTALLVVDFLQLLSFAVDPGPNDYGTSYIFNEYLMEALKVLRFLPSTTTATVTYLMAGAATATLVFISFVCVYMNRQLRASRIPPIFLIRFVRVAISLVVTVLFIPINTVYIRCVVAIIQQQGSSIEWTIIVAVILAIQVCFIVVAVTVNLIFYQADMKEPRMLGKMHSRVDAAMLLAKVVMVFVYNVVLAGNFTDEQFSYFFLPVMLGCFTLIALSLAVFQPYYRLPTNILRAGFFVTVACCAAVYHIGLMFGLHPALVDALLIAVNVTVNVLSVVTIIGLEFCYTYPVRRFLKALHAHMPPRSPTTGAQEPLDRGDALPPAVAAARPHWIMPFAVEISMRRKVAEIRWLSRKIKHRLRQRPVSLPGFEADDEPVDISDLETQREDAINDCFRVYQFAFRSYPTEMWVCASYFATISAFRPLAVTDCNKRALRIQELAQGRTSLDTMYFFFQAFRSRRTGGNDDEIARLERQRRLKSTAHDQQQLLDDRREFWRQVRVLKNRVVTPKALSDINRLTSRMSFAIDRLNANYISLLQEATPRILRQYATFLRDVMGLEGPAHLYMDHAYELEADTAKETANVQAIDLANGRSKGVLFGVVQTGLEVRALVCCLMLAGILVGMAASMYFIVRLVFQHILALFFAFTGVMYGLQLCANGLLNYAARDDPAMAVGFLPMTENLFTAILKTGSTSFIEQAFSQVELGTILALDDTILPQAFKAAYLEEIDTLEWAGDTFYPHFITTWVIGKFSAHISRLTDTLIDVWHDVPLLDAINIAQASMLEGPHEFIPSDEDVEVMSVGEALTTLLHTIKRISTANKAALLALDGTYPLGHDAYETDIAFVLANVPLIYDELERQHEEFLVTAHLFPFTLTCLLAALAISFSAVMIVTTIAVFILPLQRSYYRTLDLLAVFFFIPNDIMKRLTENDDDRKGTRPRSPTKRPHAVMFNVPDSPMATNMSTTSDQNTEPFSNAEDALDDAARAKHWRRSRPILVRSMIVGVLPRIAISGLVILQLYDAFTGFLVYRVIGDANIGSQFFMLFSGVISSVSIAGQLQRLASYEFMTGVPANETRTAMLGHTDRLNAVYSYFTSTTHAYGSHYFDEIMEQSFFEVVALKLADYLTPATWVAGDESSTIMTLMYEPNCPLEQVSPTLCAAIMGGSGRSIPFESQAGLLMASQFGMMASRMLAGLPTNQTWDSAEFFQEIDRYGQSMYFLDMMNAVYNRLVDSIDFTINVMGIFTVLLGVLIAVLYVFIFRPIAMLTKRKYDELAVNLDIVVRTHRIELDDETRTIIEKHRPVVLDQFDVSDPNASEASDEMAF